MRKNLITFSFLTLTLLISACSTLEFPGVYKLSIEQGNIITQEMVDQLKPGMSQEQVEFILGSPLIRDSFNEDRWDYIYNIKRGDEPREQYRLSIFFEAERLKYFTGDLIPSEAKPREQPAETEGESN